MDNILRDLSATKRFRDPIYGFININNTELKIIDLPIFQRLRRIHQLALTKYVYPTAENSRFVHSLGVIHTATAMLATVYRPEDTPSLNRAQQLLFAQMLRLAALLHDIGHIPFSHAAEGPCLKTFGHEDISYNIITKHPDIIRFIEESDIDPKAVASLITKKFKPKHRLIHEIVSGHLDADRADYLLRDSHFCGVKYGEYDYPRYISMFSAEGPEEAFSLVIDEKDIHVAEAFLLARYHYNMQVIYHRTRSGYDIALREFLSENDYFNNCFTTDAKGSLVEVDFEKFERLDDNYIFEKIKEADQSSDFWAKCLMRQEHLKLALDETNNLDGGLDIFKGCVLALQDAGFVAEKDFFLQQQTVDILKRTKLSSSESEDEGVSESSLAGGQNTILVRTRSSVANEDGYADIRDLSWIFKHLSVNPPVVLRVYTKPDIFEKASEIYKEIREKKYEFRKDSGNTC